MLFRSRQNGQEFIVDVEIETKFKNVNDELAKTVDYSKLIDLVSSEITSNPVNLIETLAERIATDILSKYVQAQAVEISVHKPGAPLNVEFSDLSVTIKKSK